MVPSLFLAHGAPYITIEDTEYTRFLDQLGKQFNPKAIVVFTAHWETQTLSITSTDDTYETIYDFGGFPELMSIRYPAKGSTAIAAMLQQKFADHGIASQLNTTRGLDHGTWTLLHRVYPKADIPVIQLSVHPFLPAEEQYKIGAALRGLGQEDILIIGSGATVHNFNRIQFGKTTPDVWAQQFDDWFIERLSTRDLPAIFNYMELAPYAREAVPRPEHFIPLIIAFGSGNPDTPAKVLHKSYQYGSLSYLAMQF
ncbi:dioxygenase family protein [Paenibacillus abyssi]|uniref:Dioxygenase n=1 Tax=Paenibacillus abyssi TaxID=1340531 RepID=A0A917LF85_9BACL|nr:class III extradiol ring-cleavage dioxygenase [Paenibacillus abyssi]GGG17442.1 dioxygenase [Paenibacillus abyssi]